jgi:hypothetical protein
MAAPQSDNIRYDAMVERLFPNFQPARPVWPIPARLAIWLTLEFGILIGGLATHRADLPQQLRSDRYLLELGLFITQGNHGGDHGAEDRDSGPRSKKQRVGAARDSCVGRDYPGLRRTIV